VPILTLGQWARGCTVIVISLYACGGTGEAVGQFKAEAKARTCLNEREREKVVFQECKSQCYVIPNAPKLPCPSPLRGRGLFLISASFVQFILFDLIMKGWAKAEVGISKFFI